MIFEQEKWGSHRQGGHAGPPLYLPMDYQLYLSRASTHHDTLIALLIDGTQRSQVSLSITAWVRQVCVGCGIGNVYSTQRLHCHTRLERTRLAEVLPADHCRYQCSLLASTIL